MRIIFYWWKNRKIYPYFALSFWQILFLAWFRHSWTSRANGKWCALRVQLQTHENLIGTKPKQQITIPSTDMAMMAKLITIEVRMAHSSGIRCDYYYFLFSAKHKQVLCEERQTATCQGKVYFSFVFFYTETEEEEWLKENVTNRTEIINSVRLKKAATHARSYVRGLWPVSHIIEQSLRHSSSAIPVAVALFKNYKKKKKSCVFPLLSLFSCCHFHLPPLSCSLFPLFLSQICPWSPSPIIPSSWCIVCLWQPTILMRLPHSWAHFVLWTLK